MFRERNTMTHRYRSLIGVLILAGVAISTVTAAPEPASTFRQLRDRTDRPVAEGRTDRSWTWGPAIGGMRAEQWTRYPSPPLPDGARQVQYWEKGRMEISEPESDGASPWYVTSGLLPVELMFGSEQRGYNEFARQRDSYISAVGDPASWPFYPDLLPLYENPGRIDPARLGKPATEMWHPSGAISAFAEHAGDPATTLEAGLNNHGVPRAFLQFQRQQGVIYRDGRYVREQVYDPLFVFGLPITPAVWINARVGGIEQPVLFQVFERRILTYNPANPPAFRVEMGNVGQHYYRWRYERETVGEWSQWTWETREVRSPADPNVMYTLDVEWSPSPEQGAQRPTAKYTLHQSMDGGRTRLPRYSGEIGGCYMVNVALLPPRSAAMGPGHIGLATQCADSPSESRGFGLTTYSSYDGGRRFVVRVRS
jgi:hypothetical protein